MLRAPYACPAFTISLDDAGNGVPVLTSGSEQAELKAVTSELNLQPNTYVRRADNLVVCFDLSRGAQRLDFKRS